jgi:hypothetical protein
VIEAAHVGDESVDQITKAARSGRTAVEARQQVLWFVTAERVRDGNSAEGDDMASITGR